MNRPLRFCMMTTFYPPYNFGGDGIHVHRLANELAARGHKVEIIHCIDSYRLLAGRNPNQTYQDHPNITVHGLKSPFGFLSPLATHQTGHPWLKSRHLRKILSKEFDVIHFHNISLVGGPKILEYGQGIKLYTFHEYWLFCPAHVMFKFNRAVCTRPQCLLCVIKNKRPPQFWRRTRLLAKAAKHVDAFIAPSNFVKALHRQAGLKARIEHLPNFAPDAPMEPAVPEPQIDNKPYFLFVGRLERLKGLQTLIPIFQNFRKARLLIAGSGGYERYLRRLAGDSPNIRFLGMLSEPRLQKVYREAIALVVPSICLEIFCLAAIEAFRQQTPIIVRNIGGMPEIVETSGGGFIYHNAEELIGFMNRLVENPEYRNELGLRGYQTYQREWSTDTYLDRYLALINELRLQPAKKHA